MEADLALHSLHSCELHCGRKPHLAVANMADQVLNYRRLWMLRGHLGLECEEASAGMRCRAG